MSNEPQLVSPARIASTIQLSWVQAGWHVLCRDSDTQLTNTPPAHFPRQKFQPDPLSFNVRNPDTITIAR